MKVASRRTVPPAARTASDAIARIRADRGARSVTDYLMGRGASAGFVKRLEQDLAGLPAQYARRIKYSTRREHDDRVGDLAKRTRRLAREWSRHFLGRDWTVWPHLVEWDGRVGCDRIEVLAGARPNVRIGKLIVHYPTIGEYLESLAETLESYPETHRDLFEPLFIRRPTLAAFAVLWCLSRLAETGLYKRRPITHAARLAGAAIDKPISTEQAKKILARLTKRQ